MRSKVGRWLAEHESLRVGRQRKPRAAWRADHMPYGGVKESGNGREGLRSAIESMTEEKMLVARF